jgi:hypothetical protein
MYLTTTVVDWEVVRLLRNRAVPVIVMVTSILSLICSILS